MMLESQRRVLSSIGDLSHQFEGINMGTMFDAILEIRQRINIPLPSRRLPQGTAARVAATPHSTAIHTPTILDYLTRLQSPYIEYTSPHQNTLAVYVREKHAQIPVEGLDEQEIWDIFRDVIVQVKDKCSAGNWSGEFSQGNINVLTPPKHRYDQIRNQGRR